MFPRAVNPQYVVISAGEGNNYGHPHAEVLERAADVGAALLRTAELDAIEVVTDGQGMWLGGTAMNYALYNQYHYARMEPVCTPNEGDK